MKVAPESEAVFVPPTRLEPLKVKPAAADNDCKIKVI